MAAGFSLLFIAGCIESEDDGMMEPGLPNEGPVAVGLVPPVTVAAGDHITIDVSGFFQDPDGDPLTYGAGTSNALVAGASVSGSIMTVVGVGTGRAAGLIFARDSTGGEAVQNFLVTVPNQPPLSVRSLPALSLAAGQAERIDLNDYFSDPEGDTLIFGATTANALVAGVSVSGSTLTVGAVAAGRTTITVTARDSGGGEVQQEAPVVVRSP
ncbi:Ig-like domain-containing protein [Candidatus Palauibacter sp.]|uniref:Ig-like domain-containing protein n=1 Tax=Candidatus Palauibacter sp. TaxID=3101350 RepID=UPI003AF2E9D2